MTTFRVIWPPRALSPNARVHWSKRSSMAKKYRMHARAATKIHVKAVPEGRLELRLAFYPPDLRRRDDDNLIAAFKAARDGIADALGIDDRMFVTVPSYCDPDPKRLGFVEVTLEPWGR